MRSGGNWNGVTMTIQSNWVQINSLHVKVQHDESSISLDEGAHVPSLAIPVYQLSTSSSFSFEVSCGSVTSS